MTTEKKKLADNPLALVLMASGVFFVIFLVFSGLLFLAKSSDGKGKAGLLGRDNVGVVELNGVIMDSKKTLLKLEKFEDDSSIRAVVLRLNSPGGSVAPSQEIYEAVKSYRKPLVVSMASVAASGAFYIACGAKKVFANPGTLTGSIGVIMEFANLQKLYEWAKIHRFVVKSGKFKDIGAEHKEMSAEEREILQKMVDNVLSQFKAAVSEGRKIKIEDLNEIADGRIYSGLQAKELNLVDELGTLQDAILAAAQEAGIQGRPTVIYADKIKKGFMDFILDDSSRDYEGSTSGVVNLLTSILKLDRNVEGVPFTPGIYWLWNGR